MEKKISKRAKSIHYVNNADFSAAMVEYVNEVASAKEAELESPRIPDYIGECLMKICEGLSYAPNFIRYSYRDDMVMDAVENCLRVCANFDHTRITRTGLPNAFSYFTQIAYFAFLRRIAKEKKQWDIKMKIIETASVEAFADFGMDEGHSADSLLSKMRNRNDVYNRHDDDKFLFDDEKQPKKKIIRGWNKKKTAAKSAAVSLGDFES